MARDRRTQVRSLLDTLVASPLAELSGPSALDALRRARALITGCLVGIVACAAFGIHRVHTFGTGPRVWVVGLTALAFALPPLVLARTGSVRRAGIVVPVALLALLPFDAYYQGGLGSGALTLMLAVPLIAGFCLGARWAFVFAGALVAEVIALMVLTAAGFRFPTPPDPASDHWMGALVTAGMLPFLATLAALFERQRREVLRHLQETARRNAGDAAQMRRRLEHLKSEFVSTTSLEQLKSEFIATVSHELRTPLTSIRGSLGLLRHGIAGELPPDAAELVVIAEEQSARLVLIVNALLDIQKLEEKLARVEVRDADLVELARRSLEAAHGLVAHRGVTLKFEAPEGAVKVCADPERTLQILGNLLSNAAKFSPTGAEVEVRVSVRRAVGRVEVVDHGSGISDDFKARVFSRFAQEDAADSRNNKGTGLGLSIAKGLVEQMNGAIGFTATPGGGATFFIELPLR